MRGMNRETGKALSGREHLRQRLVDAFTTPLGSRVGNRGYGGTHHLLTDRNMDPSWFVRFYAAANETVSNPVNGIGDFGVTQFEITNYTDAAVTLDVRGVWLPTRESIVLRDVQIAL